MSTFAIIVTLAWVAGVCIGGWALAARRARRLEDERAHLAIQNDALMSALLWCRKWPVFKPGNEGHPGWSVKCEPLVNPNSLL